MKKDIIEGRILLNKDGEFCKIETVNDDLFSYRNLSRPSFIHWVSLCEDADDFHVVDLCDEFVMNIFTSKTNRSLNQTKFLVELLNGNYNKLVDLETKIKNCFIDYCPGSVEEIDRILSLDNKVNDYNFEFFKKYY